MRRSFRAFSTALAAFLLTLAVPAGPAFAATAEVVSPDHNATVGASKITVQVQVSRQVLESINSVRVRLSMNGTDIAAGTQDGAATCVSGCSNSQQQVWAVEFDPMTFAPFGTPSVGRCNGGWWLQSSVNGGAFGQGVQVVRSVAPSAPSGLSATGGIEEVSLKWTRAPESDVVGYLVERRQGTGSWTTVTTLGSSADRYLDDVAAGTWTYRVVSLRGDGRTGGDAAAPCTDTGADLASASANATAEAKPVKTTSGGTTTGGTTGGTTTDGGSTGGTDGDGTTDGGTDGTTDGGTSDGTDSGDTDGTGGTDGTDGTDGGAATTGDTTPPRRVGPRQAAPPPVDRVPNLSGSLNVGSQDPVVAKERYYGDDDEYSDTLDFGDAEAIVGEDLGGGSEMRTIRIPGALQTVFGEELDVMRLLGSIASGLILITFGAHLRRWMRAGMVD